VPWFRLEDSFYDNPKVLRAGNAAVGLWVRCATWSAQHLTDGRIPLEVVRQRARSGDAGRLERAGLWTLVDGEYLIADWLEYQPSALEVKQRRAADRERKRVAREAVDRDEGNGRFTSRRRA
jgi:hypothetical protein